MPMCCSLHRSYEWSLLKLVRSNLFVFWLCYVYWVVCTALDDCYVFNIVLTQFLMRLILLENIMKIPFLNNIKNTECQFSALLSHCSIECGFELNWPRPTGSCIEMTGSGICWFTIQTNLNKVFGHIIKVHLLNIKIKKKE